MPLRAKANWREWSLFLKDPTKSSGQGFLATIEAILDGENCLP